MRDAYPAYQNRSSVEIRNIWETCVFAFDASALLDLYRISKRARNNYLHTLDRLKERVWLPHHAGVEFYANRVDVIKMGLESFTKIPELAKKTAAELKGALQRYKNYQWIDIDGIAKITDRLPKTIARTLGNPTREWKKLAEQDPIEERLSRIFEGRIGKPYKHMNQIYAKAEQRVALSMPPGFKERKDDYRRFGDVVIWMQLLDRAKEDDRPIVFITSDAKEDWWARENGKTIGPRPELIQEMHVVAEVKFLMYSPDRFLKHAADLPDIRPSPELNNAAEELQEVAKETSEPVVLTPPRVETSGTLVLLRFVCRVCRGPHTIGWEGRPGSSPDVSFHLDCHRCGHTWKAKASEGFPVDFAY